MPSEGTFSKRRAGAPKGFFAAEAAGLRWLAEAGMPTPEALQAGDESLTIERVRTGPATREVAHAFGDALARMHDAGADEFGSSPAGYDGPLYIGVQRMGNGTSASWGRFYADERVRPFLATAVAAGHLLPAERDEVEAVCARIAAGAFDDDDAPARLHGDLWSGNVLFSTGFHGSGPEVVLIDPAAHGGHRETDLAMLALFGAPYLDDILAGYQQRHPLRSGWRERVPLHQLHPLAVHTSSHGRGYAPELLAAARATAALLD